MSNEEAHRLAREKGVSRWLYALVRAIFSPLLHIYFRMHISRAECIPATSPAIVAPNHKSFWDSFFIAVCTRRHVRFMAKTELIQARYGRRGRPCGAHAVAGGRGRVPPAAGAADADRGGAGGVGNRGRCASRA
jgi:1-acyl-sn-glycerol-3-phosphate acyltransferase